MSVSTAKPTAYKLVAPLGSGATARVWSAKDASGNLVALKIGHEPSAAATLAVEALHSALALSPRLPELLRVGVIAVDEARQRATETHRGAPFLALAWQRGRSLSESYGGEPVARSVAHGVAEALADLHEIGLAHGDVKPNNILLDLEGASLIDLGLVGDAYSTTAGGGTPRYLGRGDRQLGDARARDLLALGIVLAELLDDGVRRSTEPLHAARRASLAGPIGAIARALLSPDPGARPSAEWVSRMCSQRVDRDCDRALRWLRASYLRLRRHELANADGCQPHVASWLEEALEVKRSARAMCETLGVDPPRQLGNGARITIGPLDPERRLRWLVSLVGPAASNWSSLLAPEETDLVRALESLARRRDPRAWTLADVDLAIESDHDGERVDDRIAPLNPTSPQEVSRLALAIAHTPPDRLALDSVEHFAGALPDELVSRAAEALRLAGQLGRARLLLEGRPDGEPLLVDILRRSGEHDRARALAERILADDRDRDGRARAGLARLHLDLGEPHRAASLLTTCSHAAEHEVAALVAHRFGDHERAAALARRGYSLAVGEEQRARLAATVAYVGHSRDPSLTRDHFATAADHAVQAGAVLEEATYRTGLAAALVDLGELEGAVDAARRAALLFDDVLERPPQAARAWLARAAAWAAIDAHHEASYSAREAMTRARQGGDGRAEAYAHWAIADSLPLDDGAGAEAAHAAANLLASSVEALDDDGVHACARLWRHDPKAVLDVRDVDRRAPEHSPFAQLAWWTARGERLAAAGADAVDARRVIDALASSLEANVPFATRGRAMHVARRLASSLGDSAACERFEAARRAAAETILRHSKTMMGEAARSCRWLEDSGAAPLPAHHNVDLQQLVRALGERADVELLLAKVVDVLIMWTGAERGLFLLRTKSGKLVPRAARNLARRDLEREQLAVSTSLAERALALGEPVVAVDAMSELSDSHASVHALELRSILVLPLVARGNVVGVVYLDDRFRKGAFGEREVAWAKNAAPIAAVAIADARTQRALRRAVKKARRAGKELAEALAYKETALVVAETELAKQTSLRRTRFRYDEIVGESEPVQRMLSLIDRIAESDVPVMLHGESGSGKELVARAVHRHSARARRAFVGENCGALPETLLESALFGHVRGAFTGAHGPRVGLFEAADGGTLFLDEIGEMSLGMQTKLLRVLEDGMVRPVGSERARRVDVRVIAATHRDLDKMVEAQTFREDLFYRLNVITVRVPALRERASDIPLLVQHLIHKHAPDRKVRVSATAKRSLMAHRWPGNIRQLENEVRRALLLCDDVIDVDHLSFQQREDAEEAEQGLDVRARVDRLERDLVKQALGQTRGNQTKAAKLLGLSRFGLHKLMKRLGIDAR